MISYNISTGDTLTKVFQRIPGGAVWNIMHLAPDTEIFNQHVKKLLNPRAAVGPGHILAERHFVILLSTAVFTLPLSLYRNIEKLGKVCPICCMYPSVLFWPPVNHPCAFPGVLAVDGADPGHRHHGDHQSCHIRTSNVWTNSFWFKCSHLNVNADNSVIKWHFFIFLMLFSSLPTEDAWVFAKANAIQAAGIMSFGE